MSVADKIALFKADLDAVYEAGRIAAGGSDGSYTEGYDDGYSNGYLAGRTDGHGEGMTEGYGIGRTAEREAFWNAFTHNQTRSDYNYAFYSWYGDAFYPTCDIGGTDMQRTFYNFKSINLIERCNECGIIIDFSKAKSATYCFGSSSVLTVPVVDTRGMSNLDGTFNNSHSLTIIEKVILKDDGTQTFSDNCFNCNALVDIRFEGKIGTNISFQYSPLLSEESVDDIINHLKDLTGSTTQTLTFHADVGAKLTEEQKSAITAKNWTLAY